MTQKRRTRISESSEYLHRLAELYGGSMEETRIRLLILMKEDPAMPLGEIGFLMRYPATQLVRWWRRYQRGGLAALLEPRASKRTRKANAHQIADIPTRIPDRSHSRPQLQCARVETPIRPIFNSVSVIGCF